MAAAVDPVEKIPLVSTQTARYFASPELSADADANLAHALIGEYASALFELAFERCGPPVTDTYSISFQTRRITAKALPWSAAWNPDIAQIERMMVGSIGGSQAWDVVGPMLLRLGANGVLTEAEIQLEASQKMFWDTVRLPEADRVSFVRDGDEAEINLGSRGQRQSTVQVSRDADGVWRSGDAPSVGVAWLCGHPVPLWTPADGRGYPHPSARPALADPAGQVAPLFEEAVQLLTEFAPSFVPWVANGIRNVVPLDGSDGELFSASVEEFPGLTFLSFPTPAVELAETLAHEASHHHFHALQRLVPLHDGTDKNEYYSPIKHKGRSIELTLYAFHAFANAAIYHRNLIRSRPQFRILNGRTFDESLARIRVLDRHLATTCALTEAGLTLWKPLSEALFEG